MFDALLSRMYEEAKQRPDVPDPGCGFTPMQHFVVQPNGSIRLRGECIHGGKITADRMHVASFEQRDG